MSIFNRFFKPGESDAPEDPDNSQEKSLAPLTPDELMRLEGASSKSISFPLEGKAAAAADSLIPLAANVTQAAQQYGMAVVPMVGTCSPASVTTASSMTWQPSNRLACSP